MNISASIDFGISGVVLDLSTTLVEESLSLQCRIWRTISLKQTLNMLQVFLPPNVS